MIAAGVGTGLLALIRRSPRRWWIPGSAAVVALAAVFTWLAPVVLAPVFNDFEELPPGQARSDVLELGERADVEIGEVYSVDASRRSTALNAYVSGLGPTKRVVLYDTLLEEANRGERRSVVAHELGHVDAQRRPARAAVRGDRRRRWRCCSPRASARRSGRRSGAEPGQPASLPALAVALAVTSFAIGVVGNQLSRAVEAQGRHLRAGAHRRPAGPDRAAAAARQDQPLRPDPPDVVTFLLGTHPTALERIGAAEAWEEGERP